MSKLLIADLLFIGAGFADLKKEGRKDVQFQLIAFLQVAKNMTDANHTQEVVKLEYFLSFQVLLELWVDNVSGFAVGPEELPLKLNLSDLLIEGIPKTVIQNTELLVLSLTFYVQLFILHFRSVDI